MVSPFRVGASPRSRIEIRHLPVGRAPLRVELVDYGYRQLLYYLGLLGGEVLLPASRGGLAVGFVRPLLVLGGVLPGMPLDYPGKLTLIHGYNQSRVQSSHR